MGSDRAMFPALVAGLFLQACGTPRADRAAWEGWLRVENASADHFQLWKRGEERLVLVFGHGGEQDTVGAYWLTDGARSSAPPVRATTVQLPLRSVAVGSTTHVPYICALGRVDAIAACAHIEQVRDPAFQERARQARIMEIATGDGLDREVLAALGPQALFGYPFGRDEGQVLQGLAIPTIEVSEYLEEHPLGRAEWLRFFGTLFGEEHKSDSLFAGIRARYERLRVDSTKTERPTVLFGSVWNGQWWVPPGNSYMARLIEDAGGRYVFADRIGEGNIAVDMETMITVGAQADHWGMIADIEKYPQCSDFTNGDKRLAAFRAVQTNRLFCGNTRESDLFGQALIEPDVVLQDLRWHLLPEPRPRRPEARRPYFGMVAPDPPEPIECTGRKVQ